VGGIAGLAIGRDDGDGWSGGHFVGGSRLSCVVVQNLKSSNQHEVGVALFETHCGSKLCRGSPGLRTAIAMYHSAGLALLTPAKDIDMIDPHRPRAHHIHQVYF